MPEDRIVRPHLSVVIPAYNEEQRLQPTLERIHAYLTANQIAAEILVIDDGSTDRTRLIADQFFHNTHSGRVVHQSVNHGKGHAVRQGMKAAQGRWVLMTDADLSTPIEEHAKLAQAVRDQDLDLAIGSRALANSQIEKRQHPIRENMGKTFNVLIRAITGLEFLDTQCGFKLIDRSRTTPIFERMRVDRFAFDVELVFLATRFGLRIREVPVVWRNDARSSVSLLRDPLNMLLDVVRVRWRFRRGQYNPQTAKGQA